MIKATLYVEGPADSKFLEDVISFHLPQVNIHELEFAETNGWTNLSNLKGRLEENSDAGRKNLIVFDADSTISQRQAEISALIQSPGIQSELFLFPNNSSAGNLETLLESIVNPTNQLILNCFDSYRQCVSANSSYTIPDNKVKIFAYLSAILSKKDAKMAQEKFRDYKNAKHWDLTHQSINPLKQFLTSNL